MVGLSEGGAASQQPTAGEDSEAQQRGGLGVLVLAGEVGSEDAA